MASGFETRVGVALGGWNDGDTSAFVSLAADPAKRQVFVSQLMDMVKAYGLNGIDMDWEYPNSKPQAENFVLLMREIRQALDQLDGTYFLTAAVVAQGAWAGEYIYNEVFDIVDFLNIMAYDEWQPTNGHSSYQYATTSIDYWSKRGLSREKTVLGVPFYSRPAERDYRHYVADDRSNACRDKVGNNYYNGLPTIRQKTALVHSRACGIMTWELSQDTHDDTSLLNAMWETVHQQPESWACDH